MKSNKSYNFRIYPNKSQEVLISKTFGSCRFIYNQMLARRKSIYEQFKDNKELLKAQRYKTPAAYKNEFPWLKEVDSSALAWEQLNLQNAYNNFFRTVQNKGNRCGFPKFKNKKTDRQSYSTSCTNNNIRVIENQIKLPKLGYIVYRDKRTIQPNEIIKSCTVNKSSTNKYYVSVLVEFEKEINTHKEKQNEKIIGLDMSMDKFFVATSNSENQTITPGYIRFYRKAEKKLKKAQRKFSKCKTGSKRRQKKKLKVSVIHEIIANQRRDFINKLSTKLVREYDTIVVETLSLSGMKQALSLGKSISDLGYSKFINQLQYKSLWYDKNLVMADKWFASSKLCNVCGYKNKELKLNQREWTCPNCGTWHDRDINASQNLLNLYTVGTTEINARGEIVKPNQHISGNLIKSRS